MTVVPVYQGICPVCGGSASAREIEIYGMCAKCAIGNKHTYTLNALSLLETLNTELEDFIEFFTKVNNKRPWGSQVIWARRLLSRENTGIIAPTGIGKTTLLMTYALYMYTKYKWRTLFLTPTTSLARQIASKLLEMTRKLAKKPIIMFYDSTKPKKTREEILKAIQEDNYDILIITNAFLARRRALFQGKRYDLIIADDVDSILSSSKNIILILNMLGYTTEAVVEAKRLINLRMKIMVMRLNNTEGEIYEKILNEYIESERRLKNIIAEKTYGQIIIASATGRARGPYASIMRELLNLDVSGITIYGRDIYDSYILSDINEIIDKIINIVKILGSGGIIYISSRHPLHNIIHANKLAEKISKKTGLVAKNATPSSIRKLVKGEIDLVVGSASYYGMSVRGIDAPERIKYTIFIGTPIFSINLETLITNPQFLYRILLYLRDNNVDVADHLRTISFILRKTTRNELRILAALLRGHIAPDALNNKKLLSFYESLKQIIPIALNKLYRIMEEKKVDQLGTIILYYNNGKHHALIPDIMTYIQASGRTSRLYNGSMTHGLSIIIETPELAPLIKALETKLTFLKSDFSIHPLTFHELRKQKKALETSRKKTSTTKLMFKTVLLIVESPTKARTIASFFGRPARRKIGNITVYETPIIRQNEIIYLNIIATRGHIYDLTTEPGRGYYGVEVEGPDIKPYYNTIKRCRICGHQFTYGDKCPRCGSTDYTDSIEVVNALRKIAAETDEILIATDPDPEGEKIAYDVYNAIKPINNNIYRIELHEITIHEFLKAYDARRKIDLRRVEGQIYRRVLDRLIGFSLSQRLWNIYDKNWLGAGRVQTPVLGWIVKRYQDWRKNRGFRIWLVLGPRAPYARISIFIDNRDDARKLFEEIKKKEFLEYRIIDKKKKIVNPRPPLTTDELLIEAGKQGIPAAMTMKIAQQLFEAGLITYHRTDSTHISGEGISIAKKYIETHYTGELFQPRYWGEQGTHEAIRPTRPWSREDLEKAIAEGALSSTIYLTPLHLKIYDIIFKRFIASQMKPYIGEELSIELDFSKYKVNLTLLTRIISNGWNTVYNIPIYDWIRTMQNNMIKVQKISITKSSTVSLYVQSDIVKLMKERGLGRPSTYASILSSLRRHGYVIESKKRRFLIPTKIGIEVYSTLINSYRELVSEETTRRMEETIDDIIAGRIKTDEAIIEVLSQLIKHGLISDNATPALSI